jgi:hypothetical protein
LLNGFRGWFWDWRSGLRSLRAHSANLSDSFMVSESWD